jgi:DnaK suppressor protein
MTPLTHAEREELESALAARENDLQATVQRLRAALAQPPGITGPEAHDNSEESQQRMEEAQELTDLDRSERAIGEISAARLRMRQGTYGRCEVCDEDIPLPRLKAVPTARFCLKHEAEHERSAHRRG